MRMNVWTGALITLSSIMCVSTGAHAYTSGNVLSNGDFESGSLAETAGEWAFSICGGNLGSVTDAQTFTPDGSYSLMIGPIGWGAGADGVCGPEDAAEGAFNAAELQQVEATALTIGLPTLRAKQNIEMRGVGRKFSGVYYCRSLRHVLGEDGYSCELTLRKNALGQGAGARSDVSMGKQND